MGGAEEAGFQQVHCRQASTGIRSLVNVNITVLNSNLIRNEIENSVAVEVPDMRPFDLIISQLPPFEVSLTNFATIYILRMECFTS
jgi:hypothetical protein